MAAVFAGFSALLRYCCGHGCTRQPDAWAVDFLLLNTDGKRISDAVAYRDERTEGVWETLGKEYRLTFAEHRAAFRK